MFRYSANYVGNFRAITLFLGPGDLELFGKSLICLRKIVGRFENSTNYVGDFVLWRFMDRNFGLELTVTHWFQTVLRGRKGADCS